MNRIDFDRSIFIKMFLSWFLFIPVPVINGIIRETYLKTFLTDQSAHQLSTFILSILLLLYFRIFLSANLVKLNENKLLLIGLVWVLLTIIFEFSFGYFIDGATLNKLISNYNIFSGKVWLLFLLFMFFVPLLTKKIK